MFVVKHKVSGDVYTVYNVRDDAKGYPHFLVYMNKQWLYISAKHFITKENPNEMV